MAGAILASPLIAHADAGIPMIALSFPILIYLLAGVILIEAWYFQRTVRASWRRSLSALGKANLVTTFIGFPMTWLAAFLFELAVVFSSAGVIDHFKRLGHLLDQAEYNTMLGKVFMGVLTAAWMGPTDSKLAITIAYVVLLVPAFFVSAWVETHLIIRVGGWSTEESALKRAVWRANLLSYMFLAVAGAFLLNIKLRR